jgi:hypothetical protein
MPKRSLGSRRPTPSDQLNHKLTCITLHTMNTTIRNINQAVYRALKAKAALAGKTVGEIVNEAIAAYLARPDAHARRGSLRDLKPENYPKDNERLSDKIDTVVYGV